MSAAAVIVHTKCRRLMKNTVQALKYPWADAVTLYMPGFKAINSKKNDLLKLIKPKWPTQSRFQSHMKADNTNSLADPENLYGLFSKGASKMGYVCLIDKNDISLCKLENSLLLFNYKQTEEAGRAFKSKYDHLI